MCQDGADLPLCPQLPVPASNPLVAEAPGESRASSGVATVLRIERRWWSSLGRGEQAATSDRKGTYAVAVTGNWRLTFEFDHEGAKNVNLEDYH